MWFVYILKCVDGSFYTGSSNNIEKRFKDHLSGKGARYTKSHKPESVVHKESFLTKSQALKRESEIKSWPRSKKINLVEGVLD